MGIANKWLQSETGLAMDNRSCENLALHNSTDCGDQSCICNAPEVNGKFTPVHVHTNVTVEARNEHDNTETNPNPNHDPSVLTLTRDIVISTSVMQQMWIFGLV